MDDNENAFVTRICIYQSISNYDNVTIATSIDTYLLCSIYSRRIGGSRINVLGKMLFEQQVIDKNKKSSFIRH